jgi:hypothetical protein
MSQKKKNILSEISTHGARGGDWDAGMIKRLKNFVQDIEVTFQAIISA